MICHISLVPIPLELKQRIAIAKSRETYKKHCTLMWEGFLDKRNTLHLILFLRLTLLDLRQYRSIFLGMTTTRIFRSIHWLITCWHFMNESERKHWRKYCILLQQKQQQTKVKRNTDLIKLQYILNYQEFVYAIKFQCYFVSIKQHIMTLRHDLMLGRTPD